MKEITLRIRNDQLAENFIALIEKIKGIEIFEARREKPVHKKSKIDQILDKPFDVENFVIYKRDEIYERTGIHR
jgi:hypothetical protein